MSTGVLHHMENTLKVTEVCTCRNKYTVFIKSRHFGVPPSNVHINAQS